MADGNSAAVDIHLLARNPELFLSGERNNGEGFRNFEKVDVLRFPPGFFHRPAHRLGRRGSEPHRILRETRVSDDLRQRLHAERLRFIGGHQHDGGGAIVNRRRVRGGHRTGFIENRLQRRNFFVIHFSRTFVIFDEDLIAFFSFDFDRGNFVLEVARLNRSVRALEGRNRKGVLHLTRESLFLRAEFTTRSHVLIIIRIPKAVVDHAVDERGVPHAKTAARVLKIIRNIRHRLHTARDDDFGIAGEDRLDPVNDRFHPRAADLIDGRRRNRIRDTRENRGLAGGRLAKPGLEHISHEHFVDFRAVDSGAGKRGLDRDGSELRGAEGGKAALKGALRGAGDRGDDDFFLHKSPKSSPAIAAARVNEAFKGYTGSHEIPEENGLRTPLQRAALACYEIRMDRLPFKTRENRGARILLAALLLAIFCLAWITSARASAIFATELPDLVEKILPGVANISSIKIEETMAYGMDEYFRLWQIPKEHLQTSMGSGLIISKDGYVITNNHVVEDADEVNVILYNRKSYKAKIIGRDDKLDIALLRIHDKDGSNPPDLYPLTLSDATKTRIAEPVFAVGNPFGLGHTVTSGIISAKNRTIGVGPLDNFLQTDASINPGNSGGPLFNFKAEVIGINTVIFSRTGQSAGLGFAIPINAVKDALNDLKKYGRVPRPWLGILGQPVNEAIQQYYHLTIDHGIVLANLVDGGPAAESGLKVGDILLSVNGSDVKENSDVERELYKRKPSDTVPVKILRKGKPLELKVKLAELPKLDRLPQGII